MAQRWLLLLMASTSEGAYTEIVPLRTVFQNTTASKVSPDWSVFPAKSAQQVVPTPAGALILAEGSLFVGKTFAPVSIHFTDSSSKTIESGAHIIAERESSVVGLATPKGLFKAACTFVAGAQGSSCTFTKLSSESLGVIYDSAVSDGEMWIAAEKGLFWRKSEKESKVILPGETINAVATNTKQIMAGNADKIYTINPSDGSISRWEWVTDVATESGGVIDDAITAMAFGDTISESCEAETAEASQAQDLFIGNPTCLNILDGQKGTYRRVAADQGLPVANITSVATHTYQGQAQVWVGTTLGVALLQQGADPRWRYFYGPRYLVGANVRSLAVVSHGSEVEAVVITDQGISWLQLQQWSLAQKAQHYESILRARHVRSGMTAGCTMSVFGAPEKGCVSLDDDNNGLWTSLVVVAEYMRYAGSQCNATKRNPECNPHLTGEKEALESASLFFNGMVNLNHVTGKPGLMARSACDPLSFANHSCGYHTWVHDKEQWHNSSNPQYKGWIWKGDTSSDESTGHIFALSVVSYLSPVPKERMLATQLLEDIVGGIVRNGYLMIDVTGKATTWGRWAPEYVNGYRGFSDERGLQMLAYLAALANATGDASKLGVMEAYKDLTNATNQYNENMLNLKITTPIDDNYSDDELTMLPFYTFLTACPPSRRQDTATAAACPFDRAPVLAAFERTFSKLQPERSDLWSAMYLALGRESKSINEQVAAEATQATDATDAKDLDLKSDILWNLQNWPLELIQWPMDNSHRIDLIYEAGEDRFGKKGIDTTTLRPPIPANERQQYRWNANPYEVATGGDGMSESDPGAWLLPYWMARYYSLIDGTA